MTKKLFKGGALALLAGATVFGSGCPFGAVLSPRRFIPTLLTSVATEFLTDNDSVFDLFQDDFGTGATFDDRSTAAPSRAEP